ncbi:hypothetical protein BCR32DRAFT_300311 [Anaeromyces robustus]|uniref:Uncharacterized protein n=1 Tax=Anaeromyces robustus TaxID=1754192 RepID=A0A1Y1X3P7_9FUNG|nr:hypothetical protein BCR32DRAFT_300311 [Anaeromyces robustus]|eukprot:ORX80258.1 hypothetical protein BCR32DRAFT_300311 [Anaeromyces robustus]
MTKENIQPYQQTYSSSEIPPPYTLDYTESPFDENITTEYNDSINIPDHEIAVIDKKYVTNKHIKYCLRERLKINNKKLFKIIENETIDILDSEENEQFYCEKNKEIITIYDTERTPIFNVNMEMKNNKEIYIYEGTNNSELCGTIKTSSKKNNAVLNYNISIFNKYNNENEELEMRFNKFRKYYSIYCNKGKDKEILIGIIKKLDTVRKQYTVEIAPMVDYMFLLGLGTLLIILDIIKKKNHQNRIEYLNFFLNAAAIGCNIT